MQVGNGVASVGMETSLLPSSCSQAPEFLGAASSSVPPVECVCALPPPHNAVRNQLERNLKGEKMGHGGCEAQVKGLCPLSGVSVAILIRGSAGGTAWLGCPCPLGSACCLAPALPPSADVGSRGCSALASAPAASEIKDTAAAVPALEISWLLGCGGTAGWNWSSWSSSACSGMSRSAAGDTGSHQNPGRRRGKRRGGCSMAGLDGDGVWVGPPVLGNVAETT